MYGTIINPIDFDEEYISLRQLDDIDDYETNNYYINSSNIAGCILVCTTIYGIAFYLIYYVL